MDLPTFRADFLESTQAADAFVTATLAGAATVLDPVVWAAQYDQGHGYLTVHRLALSPYGQGAKFIGPSDRSGPAGTTYSVHYMRMRRALCCGGTAV
jgi:hypothetical protein